MTLYVDARCLQDENYSERGVGFHSYTLLKNAKKYIPEKIIGLTEKTLPPLSEKHASLFDSISFARIPFNSVYNGRSDLFISLSPLTHAQWLNGPLLQCGNIASYAIIYDFIPLNSPDPKSYFPTISKMRAYTGNMLWLKKFDFFAAISKYTSKQAIEKLNLNKSRITITGCAIRDSFVCNSQAENDSKPLTKFEIGKYCVCVTGSDQRKNQEFLLQVLSKIYQSGQNLGLIFVGKLDGYLMNHLKNKFIFYGGQPGNIEFLKNVKDGDLRILLKNALVSLNPSLDEGFSMPIIESVASGCPSLASLIPAHQELLDHNSLFSIDSCNDLSAKIINLTKYPLTRENLLKSQLELVDKFSEYNVAERFWSFLLQKSLNKAASTSFRVRSNDIKPKIAFLTPFPPDKSGVADYTAKSLEEIGKLAIVDVYTDSKVTKKYPGVRAFFPISEKPFQAGIYDKVVSVIGNSHFHEKILKYHLRYGGPCIQHDNRMTEFYAWSLGFKECAERASKFLGKKIEVEEINAWLADPSRLPTLFLEEIINYSNPLILHSLKTRQLVKEIYNYQANYLPFCLYRNFNGDVSKKDQFLAKKKLGLKFDQITISTFGFVSKTKCPIDCIYSIYFLNLWGVPSSLYFIGELGDNKEKIVLLGKELGILDKINYYETWVSPETYNDFLLASDFAIQLRSFGLGGLSGSLLDCIGAALPTVANRDLAESTQSPDYVYKVDDNISAILIAEKILEAYKNEKHLVRDNISKKKFFSEHNFHNYASQLLNFLGL